MQMEVFDGFTVRPNLYALLIAPKGEGKTPASNVFFGELFKMEKEEKQEYDEKKAAGSRPGDKGDGVVDASSSDTDERSEEARMFHKKTRVCESVTKEALTLTLYHGSGNVILKTDEFKVLSSHRF